MQRQHQERVHFPRTSTSDSGFQIFQPSTVSSSTRLKTTSQLSRNMGIETEKNSRTAQHVQQQQQQQDSALGTERLTSLHAKLHQEADKIRKWKVQTEMDMKHKLENENLSTKLQEELSNREELLQRVKNTRDLVAFLKDQEDRLEEKLSSCETERTELKYLEKEHAQQFEEMTAEFRRLQMETKHDISELIKQVQEEQEREKNLEKELTSKIAESDSQIKLLTNKIDEKDIALREVHVMLQKNEEKLHAADKDIGAVVRGLVRKITWLLLCHTQVLPQQQVSNLSTELTTTQQHLDTFKKECALLQTEKEQLATELVEERDRADSAKRQEDSVQEALNNSVAIFNKRQDDMQREIDLLKAELTEEQKRLKEARAQLTESLTFNETLKSSRDVLLLEKTEMELCLEKLKVELTELQTEKYKNKAEISSLEAEVESLQTHLQQEQQTSSRLQVQVNEINPRYASLEKEKKHLQQELHALKKTIDTHREELEKSLQAHSEDSRQTQHLQDTITHLHNDLSDTRTRMEQLQAELVHCQGQLSVKDEEKVSTTRQLDQTRAEFKELLEEHEGAKNHISDLTDQLNGNREEKDSLQARLADLENQTQLLQQEKETKGQVVEQERQSSVEKRQHLEQQLKDVTGDIKAKNKAVKDLEKELKTVRGKVTALERRQEERSREVDYLKQELSASEEAKQQSDKILASLQAHLELETEKSQQHAQQVDQLQRDLAQAVKEKAESSMQCERQIIEMTATLEKYTSDHQKLLMLKDKAIQDLQHHNAQLTAVTQEKESSTKELKEESERLQQQLVTLRTQMEELEQRKAAEIESLQEQLTNQAKLLEEQKQCQPEMMQSASLFTHNMEVETQTAASVATAPTTPVAQVQGQPMEPQQRSILRQTGSVSKRRKVAFISPSIDNSERSNTDSDSSVDLEIEDQAMTQSKPGPRTPLRLRHSPHKNRSVVSTPVVLTPSRGSRLEALGKKTKLKQNVRTAQSSFPEPVQVKEKEFCKTPSMQHPPMRTSRFFRTSPKERNKMKKQEEAKERMAWFDDDKVYGFGFDD